jgi:hypothetical protein
LFVPSLLGSARPTAAGLLVQSLGLKLCGFISRTNPHATDELPITANKYPIQLDLTQCINYPVLESQLLHKTVNLIF